MHIDNPLEGPSWLLDSPQERVCRDYLNLTRNKVLKKGKVHPSENILKTFTKYSDIVCLCCKCGYIFEIAS